MRSPLPPVVAGEWGCSMISLNSDADCLLLIHYYHNNNNNNNTIIENQPTRDISIIHWWVLPAFCCLFGFCLLLFSFQKIQHLCLVELESMLVKMPNTSSSLHLGLGSYTPYPRLISFVHLTWIHWGIYIPSILQLLIFPH